MKSPVSWASSNTWSQMWMRIQTEFDLVWSPVGRASDSAWPSIAGGSVCWPSLMPSSSGRRATSRSMTLEQFFFLKAGKLSWISGLIRSWKSTCTNCVIQKKRVYLRCWWVVMILNQKLSKLLKIFKVRQAIHLSVLGCACFLVEA